MFIGMKPFSWEVFLGRRLLFGLFSTLCVIDDFNFIVGVMLFFIRMPPMPLGLQFILHAALAFGAQLVCSCLNLLCMLLLHQSFVDACSNTLGFIRMMLLPSGFCRCF